MNRESPNIPRLLATLTDYDVQFVLAGSVAVHAWGADIEPPGDLDIIPAMDEINLRKLQHALSALDAKPFPVTGEWKSHSDGFVWQEFDPGDPRRGDPPPPDPMEPGTFDSLFGTIYGTLDIVPEISGIYAEVLTRASERTVSKIPSVKVLSLEDLLVLLTVPRRQKDAGRVAYLQKLQRQRPGQ